MGTAIAIAGVAGLFAWEMLKRRPVSDIPAGTAMVYWLFILAFALIGLFVPG